jgi:putative ABC transport system ATP-binding protein
VSDNQVIVIDKLTRIFETDRGKVCLFNNLSAEVAEGEFVAVTGPTGVGKTTLINIVAGLEKPTHGTVTVLGRDVTNMDDDSLTEFRGQMIGLVFQGSQLLDNLDVFGNIELPLVIQETDEAERKRRTKEIIEFFGLADRSSAYPASLSVGERRKAAIARALVTEPPLLLMDEPTGGLDTPAVNVLTPLLRGIHYLHKGTILMATNSLTLARIASREIPLVRPKFSTVCRREEA